MTTIQKITYYILLVLMSALFLFAAYPKLIGDPMAVAGFAQAHLPIWFMYFTGVAEVLGAIGLWIPKLQKWAAYGLLIVLIGAIVTTVAYQNAITAAFPFVVSLFLTIILWLRKKGAPAGEQAIS